MKTLVVDDELVSRKKLQKIMEGFGKCEATDRGEVAIKVFKKSLENETLFDLITLDIAMPGIDGKTVLHEIREIEREKKVPRDKLVKIIMVTCHSDRDTIVASMQEKCNDYIVKPFDREIILKKLEKIELGERAISPDIEDSQASPLETKESVIDDIIFRFKHGEIDLPSLPQITIKFKEMVNRGTNLQEVADLLKQDPSISFKLISVANSVFYRGMVENKTVGQAIGRLGLNTTRRYVDAIAYRAFFTTANKKYIEFIENLWKHSLSCAYASQIVCDVLKIKLPDDAFTMGLLHDIGKLVLLQIVGELEIKGQLGKDVSSKELFNDLDTHHGKFGAALLKRHRFSEGYAKIAFYHDSLQEADPISNDIIVVHFSNLLVKSIGYNPSHQSEIDLENAESTRLLKLDSEIIPEIKEQVKKHMEWISGYLD